MNDIYDLTLESGQTVDLTLEPGIEVDLEVSMVAPPGADGPPGPPGTNADDIDPPIDLTVLFENALA